MNRHQTEVTKETELGADQGDALMTTTTTKESAHAPRRARRFVTGRWLTASLSMVAVLVGAFAWGSAGADGGWQSRGDRHRAGDPLPGLSPQLAAMFEEGRDLFEHEFTPSEGLGPVYNATACQTCHGGLGAAPGGADPNGVGSELNVTHFGFDNQGYYDPMRELGGPVLQIESISDQVPSCPLNGETLPASANTWSIRHTPPVWGFGLIDAIPDSEILARENLGVDGIHGVAHWHREMDALAASPTAADPQLHIRGPVRVGRFGWKAQTATLHQFSAEPMGIENGLSTAFFPQEFTPAGLRFGDQLPAGCDVADSQPNDPDGTEGLALYHFQALLAPPPRKPMVGRFARRGQEVFAEVGCASCHTPTMQTGPEYWMVTDNGSVRVPELENQEVHLYSDLLTHDMGDELADMGGQNIGRVMGRADGRRWRTTPLWGLRFKNAYLHDGRTASVHRAIMAHGGEGEIVRGRYQQLSVVDRVALLWFLRKI